MRPPICTGAHTVDMLCSLFVAKHKNFWGVPVAAAGDALIGRRAQARRVGDVQQRLVLLIQEPPHAQRLHPYARVIVRQVRDLFVLVRSLASHWTAP